MTKMVTKTAKLNFVIQNRKLHNICVNVDGISVKILAYKLLGVVIEIIWRVLVV